MGGDAWIFPGISLFCRPNKNYSTYSGRYPWKSPISFKKPPWGLNIYLGFLKKKKINAALKKIMIESSDFFSGSYNLNLGNFWNDKKCITGGVTRSLVSRRGGGLRRSLARNNDFHNLLFILSLFWVYVISMYCDT